MTDDILAEIRLGTDMKNAIIGNITLYKAQSNVNITLITDRAYTPSDKDTAYNILRKYVPEEFSFDLDISKVTPDASMVKRKVYSFIQEKFPAISAVMEENDVTSEQTADGFKFVISTIFSPHEASSAVEAVEKELKKHFCGNFYGKAVKKQMDISSIQVETEEEEPVYVFAPRTFPVTHFVPIETVKAPERAVYIADFNYASESTYVCGYITDISERTYTKSSGEEKLYYIYTLNDGTGSIRLTYFTRKKSLDRIKTLANGEGIVCECRSEVFNGTMRYTAVNIDRGNPPENFVPEKRPAKPVPLKYHCITPQPFTDYNQSDLFSDETLPDCLKNNTFVVFDLETTGLQSSPSPDSGEMDGIIEIGAYKITDGAISEKFSTFVNPLRKSPLPDKIKELTGITDEQVNTAPSYKEVLPDFVKFCDGAILVGHNIIGFDFKFVDFYAKSLGYEIERKLIDTLILSQQLLKGKVKNNKFNTVADYFKITFNHARAEDDALATAKIFIQLIKIKKSLPDM